MTKRKNTEKEWSFDGKTYVMGRINKKEWDRIYECFDERSYNCIFQVNKNIFGFKRLEIVEKEEIPNHILIEIGCFGGFDPKNWNPEIFKIAENVYGKPLN